MGAVLEAACSPRSTLLSGQGVRGESNPPLRRSQRRVPHRYTTDTISQRRLRLSEVAKPQAAASESRPGWTRTTDLPHVKGLSWPLNDGTR